MALLMRPAVFNGGKKINRKLMTRDFTKPDSQLGCRFFCVYGEFEGAERRTGCAQYERIYEISEA